MAALDRRDRRHTLSDATLAYILLFSIGSAIGVGMFVVIALSTRRKRRSFGSGGPEPDTEALAHFETSWLVMAAGALAAVILFTIFVAPYGEAAGPDPQIVNVSGQQFAFVLQPATVKVGQPVEFRLSSSDVTHGFAVFDPDGDFQFQAQIVPEHTQLAVWTPKKTGTHEIVCFEFCGVNHHNMLGQFEVTP